MHSTNFLMQNSSFQESTKTKVSSLGDSLGVSREYYLHDVTRKNFSNSAVITRPSESCFSIPAIIMKYMLIE